MVRLCKEFHNRKDAAGGEPLNVLLLPQVKDIISTWQDESGAQQDAGEFLLYMLNGMHEECKWKPQPASSSASGGDVSDIRSLLKNFCAEEKVGDTKFKRVQFKQ